MEPFRGPSPDDTFPEPLRLAVDSLPRDTTPCPPPQASTPPVMVPPQSSVSSFDLASDFLDDE